MKYNSPYEIGVGDVVIMTDDRWLQNRSFSSC